MDRFSGDRSVRPTLSAAERPEQAVGAAHAEASRAGGARVAKTKMHMPWKLLAGVLVLLAIGAGAWWFMSRGGVPGWVDTSKYQAVFLQNGEFYFGKVKSMTSDEIQLTNVFYIQKSATTGTDTKAADANSLQLIKLGDEVHGPDDMMSVNRGQVLYVENLKNDGKVAQTIAKYYEQNKK